MRRARIWILLLLLGGLACWGPGCSGGAAVGGGSGGGFVGAGGPQSLPLAGDPASSALSALPELRTSPVEVPDILDDVLLTRLSLVLQPTATIADLNAAARAVGATGIAFSRAGSPFLDLIVPRQPGVAELKELARRLVGLPGILFADVGRQMSAQILPSTGGSLAPQTDLDYLRATRFPGAWNVKRLADRSSEKVTVIVPDFYFGQHEQFDLQLGDSDTLLDAITGLPSSTVPPGFPNLASHGFQVVATLTARFDALLTHGANPSHTRLDLRLVNGHGLSRTQVLDALGAEVLNSTGPVMVSSSMGYNTGIEAQLDGTLAADVRQRIQGHFLDAIYWADFATRPGVADRMLVVSAAGNDANHPLVTAWPGLRSARLGSALSLATVLDQIETIAADEALWNPPGVPDDLRLDTATVTGLIGMRDFWLGSRRPTDQNLAMVGSASNKEQLADLLGSDFSNDGAPLRAVGEIIGTITLAEANKVGGLVNGTSFSAPQVAGLASFLWLLDGDLKSAPVAETIRLIQDTSRSNGNVDGVIDAYGAVLALDVRNGNFRIRRELLDVFPVTEIPDGFSELDLQEFERQYGLSDPGGPKVPTGRDYSRFDLNGDGFTGGTGIGSFDLDADGTDTEVLDVDVEGETVSLDESALTDLDILRFYAYVSGPGGGPLLYDTSSSSAISERTRILGGGHLLSVSLAQVAVGETVAGCPDSTTSLTEVRRGLTPPFNVRAGGTSFTMTRESETVLAMSISTSLPDQQICTVDGAPEEHNSGASVQAIVTVQSQRAGLMTVVESFSFQPDRVTLSNLGAGRSLDVRIFNSVGNGFSGTQRIATFTFTPDP